MSRRFLSPYYVANSLLILSYYFLRRYLRAHNDFIASQLGGPVVLPAWEMRVAGVLSLALSINGLKARYANLLHYVDHRHRPTANNRQ